MPDSVVALAAQNRAALLRQDAKALKPLIEAYGRMYRRLQDQIDALALEIAGRRPTKSELLTMTRYQSLIGDIREELSAFSKITQNAIGGAADVAMNSALKDSSRLVQAAAAQAGITAKFTSLPKTAVENLLGFLDRDGPLYAKLKQMAPSVADQVSERMVEGIGLGWNPKKLANELRTSFGVGLTDALRTTRTAQLYAYREASRANYVANSKVVTGWVWTADIGGNPAPCASCISQHGTVHDLDETLNDHHNGRCAALPVVKGRNPIEESGESWFNQLSPEKQREILGPGKHDALSEGRFSFGDLSAAHPDDVYGSMRSVATLAELGLS